MHGQSRLGCQFAKLEQPRLALRDGDVKLREISADRLDALGDAVLQRERYSDRVSVDHVNDLRYGVPVTLLSTALDGWQRLQLWQKRMGVADLSACRALDPRQRH